MADDIYTYSDDEDEDEPTPTTRLPGICPLHLNNECLSRRQHYQVFASYTLIMSACLSYSPDYQVLPPTL